MWLSVPLRKYDLPLLNPTSGDTGSDGRVGYLRIRRFVVLAPSVADYPCVLGQDTLPNPNMASERVKVANEWVGANYNCFSESALWETCQLKFLKTIHISMII